MLSWEYPKDKKITIKCLVKCSLFDNIIDLGGKVYGDG